MRKLLTISIVMLAVCTQGVAQEPPDLVAIRGAFAKAIDDHDVDAIVSHFADDGVHDIAFIPAPLVSPEQMKAFWVDQFSGSPDWHTEEGRVLTVGNIVVVEHAAVGTDTGESSTGPPTGLPWTWPHLDIYEFEGEKIKRLMSYGDYASILIQLGLAPAPEPFELIPSFALPDPEPTGLSPMEADVEHMVRYNGQDITHYAKMFRSDAQIFPSPLGMALDRNAWIAMDEMTREGFSDGTTEVVRRVDLGDGWILAEMILRSIHTGTYLGVPASGNMIDLRGAYITHYDDDGLITHHNIYWDNLTLMTQMTTAEWPLDGVWVKAVPTPLGNVIVTGVYTAQDAAKTRFSVDLKYVNALPLLIDLYPDAEETKFAGGQVVKIARNKYEGTFLEYDTKTVGPGQTEIVGMGVISATFEIVAPDLIYGGGTGSYYMAAQDADQDGFPDEGQEPVLCLPWGWTGKRLTAMPGCIPTPMPQPGQ